MVQWCINLCWIGNADPCYTPSTYHESATRWWGRLSDAIFQERNGKLRCISTPRVSINGFQNHHSQDWFPPSNDYSFNGLFMVYPLLFLTMVINKQILSNRGWSGFNPTHDASSRFHTSVRIGHSNGSRWCRIRLLTDPVDTLGKQLGSSTSVGLFRVVPRFSWQTGTRQLGRFMCIYKMHVDMT